MVTGLVVLAIQDARLNHKTRHHATSPNLFGDRFCGLLAGRDASATTREAAGAVPAPLGDRFCGFKRTRPVPTTKSVTLGAPVGCGTHQSSHAAVHCYAQPALKPQNLHPLSATLPAKVTGFVVWLSWHLLAEIQGTERLPAVAILHRVDTPIAAFKQALAARHAPMSRPRIDLASPCKGPR